MDTEVCVVTYQSEATLPALVASLGLLAPGSSLAVHDNSPGRGSLDVAAALAETHEVPFRGEACATGNCGFGAACNSLAASSTARDLLFLNPDARLLTWPEGLRAEQRIVGPVIRDPSGGVAATFGRRRLLRDEIALRWGRRAPARPTGVGYVSGAALLVDRTSFLDLGGFDEGYFMYYEDIDLCTRAVQRGLAVVMDENWQVEHVGGHSVGRSAPSVRLAHLRSYESGRRYHGSRRSGTTAYDALSVVDGLLRAAVLLPLRGRRTQGRADLAVAGAAVRNLLRRRPLDR